MNMDATSYQRLVQRVEELEKRNRRVQRVVLAVLALGGMALLMGQSPPNAPKDAEPRNVVEAQRFVLLGRNGRPAAMLGTVKGSHGLFLFDDEEQTRAELILRPSGAPELNFYDEQGRLVRGDVQGPAPVKEEPAAAGKGAGEEKQASPVPQNIKKADRATDKAAKKDNTQVYVTPFGKKYHRENCRFLSKNANAMPLQDAAKKYEPCNVCRPPEP